MVAKKIKSEFDSLPARVRRVINTVRRGQRLTKSLRLKETGDLATQITFAFEPSGRRAGLKSSQEAIASGFLLPMGDGLLGDDSSQTWRAK